MGDQEDEEFEPHDYESIDEFLEVRNAHTPERVYNEEGRSPYGLPRPSTLPRPARSVSVDSSDSLTSYAASQLQFSFSIPKDQIQPVYQPKVPIQVGHTSEPATPVAAKNRPQNTILRSKTLQDMDIPPPVIRSNKPPPRPPKPSPVVVERKEPTVISPKPYNLSDFCSYEPLPKMVRVSAGYYGATERTSISEGEEFVFYLLKTVLTIPARPVGSTGLSEAFYISVNSMLKIAIIDKRSDSIRKYVYSSPSELMANRKECPKIVCVTKDHFIRSTLLPAGTLLFLDDKPRKRVIHCRTQTKKEYELPLDCACSLTTHPADTQIYIREYMAMVNRFPVDVQLFHGDSDDIYAEPSEVTSSIGMTLTLDNPIKQKSIIAKTDLEGTRKDNPITVEIPFDLPIEVEAIRRDEEDMDEIYSQVLDLYENFNPETIEKSYSTCDTDLYHEYEKADIDYELECPYTDYQPLKDVLKKREEFLREQQAAGTNNPDDLEKLKEENRKLQEEISMLRQKKNDNYTKLYKLPNIGDGGDYTPLAHMENIQELKNMNDSGICQLLQNMGLSQYVEKFKENHIDGVLMAELSEDDLSDLVQSSLHKKRLMLIISGQTSIRKYFDAENPYATM